MRKIFLFIILLGSLFAHKLNIFSYLEEDKIIITSYFSDGSACRNCEVLVDGKRIGVTNIQGEYILKANKGEYTVAVEAVGGHRAEELIKNIGYKEAKKRLKKEEESQLFKKILGVVAIIVIFFFLWVLKRKN